MKKFETADWSFYPSTQEIEYPGGDKVALPTRLSNCLECLINARGDVVDYDTLLLSVWKTTHREASTISSVISELRRTIQCSKTGTTYIKNVPKKGYRFVGDYVEKEITLPDSVYVEPIKEPAPIKESASTKEAELAEQIDTDVESVPESDITPKHPAEQEHITQPDSRRTEKSSAQKLEEEHVPGSGSKLVVAVIILLLIGSFAIWEWLAEDDTSLEPTINKTADKDAATNTQIPMYSGIEILTHESGQSASFDVSPDLNWLVYSHKPEGADSRRLIAKNLSTGERLEIPFNPGEEYWSPHFSNDGKKLVYVRSTETSCAIETIDFKDQHFLSDTIKFAASCGSSHIFTTPTFSNDDTFIYFSASTGLNDPLKVHRVDLLQSTVQQVTSPTQKGRGDYSMSMSPDGMHLAIVRDEYWGQSVVLVYSIADGTIKRLKSLPYIIYQVAWLDNKNVVVKATPNSFEMVNIETGKQHAITDNSYRKTVYPVIRGDVLFAYQGMVFENEIWVLDLTELTFKPEISSQYNDYYPVVAGNKLYFVSDRSGSVQIWLKSENQYHKVTNRSDETPLMEPMYSVSSGNLYTISQNQVLEINKDTGETSIVFEHEKIIQNAAISDDGHTMTFAVEENNRSYIESLDLKTLLVTRITPGYMGRVANNHLYYLKSQQSQLIARNLISGEEVMILEHFPANSVRTWNVTESKIVYFLHNNTTNSLAINVYDFVHDISNFIDIEKALTSISCKPSKLKCYVSVRDSGDTSIVVFKKKQGSQKEKP